MPPWRRFAPAKLNLYLHVTGRRADGLHLLDSLVAFATVGDELTVAPADALTLTVVGPFARMLDGAPSDNLAWRAAAALARRLAIAPAVAIHLTKNLPVASGIGGGSSDAAACLRALAALWQCGDDDVPREVAASLGSDVPACLHARPLWLGGIGDRIERADVLPACGVVLVNPGIPLPTASVYRAFDGRFSAADRFAIPNDPWRLAGLLAARRNDLTEAAIGQVPAIADVLARLAATEHCLLARMSGSGATCFALYATRDEANVASRRLQRECPGWWVVAAGLNSEPEYSA
ncbi:MAG TPA: 4-(cytidine 5'-diphospho)-2-C-methyl-D-erythritol kinase [Stellaceae bacterium]|nr:4-(cytidine 5'-diphospho)-2-C-methyl-D-erythritol kinase [Stellaceae bacterium]